MARIDAALQGLRRPGVGRLVLYLEGPQDRAILQAWCRRLFPPIARSLFQRSVILGGRQPARAAAHFRRLGDAAGSARGLCVLDRDDGSDPVQGAMVPGLSFFTWGRRHIESYLLVPGAIRRALGRGGDDDRLERALRSLLPPEGDEEAYRELDAKRLLAPGGPLPRAFGSPLPLARIARATRASELHPDVHALFERVRGELGLADAAEVRSRRSPRAE